jgi:Tol biopolymer transport system component
MTTERDPNLLIATWLEEGPTALPPETRRAIETAARTMPQRRLGFGRPWRFSTVNGALRPTLLVAVILVSVVGFAVYGRLRPTQSIGTPTAIPSASLPAAPSDSPAAPVVSLQGRIAFTRYDAKAGMYGNYLGTFVANADGSGAVRLGFPTVSDGVEWSPDGTKLLLGNSPPQDGMGFRPVIINPDGSGYRRLNTPGRFSDMYCSAWSPDGSLLLCGIADATDERVGGIVTVDVATGAIVRRLSSGANPGVKGTTSECSGGDSPGAFSPDGTEIAFVRHQCGSKPDPVADEQAGIYVADADGSGSPRLIVNMGVVDSGEPQVRWSPDGQWLLFGSDGAPYLIHPDGSGLQSIGTSLQMGTYQYSPAWSPDGSRIIFSAWREGQTTDLWTTKADGTDARRLTNDAASEDSISWTP